MKRLFMLLLAISMLAPAVDAGRKRAKAGKIEDGVYKDNVYSFQFKVDDNWKARIGDEKDDARVVLTQRKYDIPPKYLDAPDYTKVPRLVVFVTKSNMSAPDFVDSLTDDDYESDLKKDVTKEFDFLREKDIVPKGKTRIDLAGEKGVFWQGQSKYIQIITKDVSSTDTERVYGNYGGAIFAVDHDGDLYLFHVMCEWEYYETVLKEVQGMVNSLQFTDQEG
jgi:hypothetical protein